MGVVPDTLAEVFSPPIIEALRSVATPTEELRMRLHVLTGDLPHLPDLHVCRDAWNRYLTCALRLGFFDGAHGEDLRARLVGRDDDLFSSAISECFAAWFLAERLCLSISPHPAGRSARVLEMAIRSGNALINAEVKAPHKPLPVTVWPSDGSEVLRSAIKSANKQFAQNEMNLLIIVPRLPLFLFEEPRELRRMVALKALIVEETLRVPINPATGGPTGPVRLGLRPSGEFVKARRGNTLWFTRTGGTLLINEHIPLPVVDMTYSAMLIHNPYARNPLPTDLWNGVDQFCETNRQWSWREADRLRVEAAR